MAGKGKDNKNAKIKLKQPDRSGPDPSQATLFDIAEKRGLLKEEDAAEEEVLVGRLGESILWSFSITMLHFTLDVLVTHQYAQAISWTAIWMRAVQAFPGMFSLYQYGVGTIANTTSHLPPILLFPPTSLAAYITSTTSCTHTAHPAPAVLLRR
jgi:hypothetical protein